MIRTILVLLLVVVLLLLSLVLFVVEKIVGLFSRQAKEYSTLRIIQACMWLILWVSGAKVRIYGKENLPPKDEAVMYVMNHRSFYDALLGYILFPAPTGFIAKKELEKVPIVGFWFKELHGLFLDRKDIRQGMTVILNAIENVKNGLSMCVCPEGTRSKDEDETQLLPFHEGSFKIATKSGCRIVPIAITHASRLLEDHFPKIKGTDITITVGTPIDPKTLSREESKFLGRTTRAQIVQMLEEAHKKA
ncbi:MAG: lysophospholipid acyltransferase family protein [Lachnospiraceae bacterium]|nr:lysophospholipid acyltransferase family protein [Lachnospiraceae bacterium]